MALAQKNEQQNDEPLITGEELFQRPNLEPCELVNGRVVPMTLAGYNHGIVTGRLYARLLAYEEATGRGQAMVGDVGVYTRKAPDTVRGADVAFISQERFARRGPLGFLDVAPEIVGEVVSPTDRRGQIETKVEEYLAAGVERVWVVYPRRREILVHRRNSPVERLGASDFLRDEEILPGFSLPVSYLFPE